MPVICSVENSHEIWSDRWTEIQLKPVVVDGFHSLGGQYQSFNVDSQNYSHLIKKNTPKHQTHQK